MNRVATIAVTLAAGVALSGVCWGTEPTAGQTVAGGWRVAGFAPSTAAPKPAAVQPVKRAAAQVAPPVERPAPQALAPESVEGTWVSDDSRPAPGETGGPIYDGPVYGDPHAAGFDGPPSDGCADCDPSMGGACGWGPGRFCGGGMPFGDLWTEVHSHRRIYVKTEYLQWRGKGARVPELVTTSPLGTDQADAGVLPDAELLFGNERLDDQVRSGYRFNIGYWLVDGEFSGIEAHYLQLDADGAEFHAESNFSDGSTLNDVILARPFLNLDPTVVSDPDSPIEDSVLVAFPDFTPPASSGLDPFDLNGRIDVKTFSDVQSAGVLLRNLLWIDFVENWRVDVLGGYRFFRLNNNLTITDSFTFPAQGQIASTQFDSVDEFSADNQFNGGELGLVCQFYRGRFSIESTAKIALGAVAEEVEIKGNHSVTTLGTTIVREGGFLAQPTNIGVYERDTFAILPEANVTARFDVTHNLRLSFGYSYLYLNKVVRSGDHVDRTINPTQIDGTLDLGNPPDEGFRRPRFPGFQETDYWLYGFNAGMEYRW